EMRRRTFWFSASEISVTLTRLGRKRRRVLLLAWLTLLPDWTPLPVSSQARDMVHPSDSCSGQTQVPAQYGARSPIGGLKESRRSIVAFGRGVKRKLAGW